MKKKLTGERDGPLTRQAIAIVTAAATAALPFAAQAGKQQGIVAMHHTTYQASASGPGLAFFVLEGAAKSNRPACNTFEDRWVIDNSRPAAKFQHAVLLAAALSGRSVVVQGTNACEVWSDSETVVDVRLSSD